MRSEDLYLRDILAATGHIEDFLAEHDKDAFLSSVFVRSAVQYQMIIIGEAVTKLSKEFRQSHSNIPWRDISSFRNFAVHAYFATRWDEVWDSASVDVPDLRHAVAEILANEFPPNPPSATGN